MPVVSAVLFPLAHACRKTPPSAQLHDFSKPAAGEVRAAVRSQC